MRAGGYERAGRFTRPPLCGDTIALASGTRQGRDRVRARTPKRARTEVLTAPTHSPARRCLHCTGHRSPAVDLCALYRSACERERPEETARAPSSTNTPLTIRRGHRRATARRPRSSTAAQLDGRASRSSTAAPHAAPCGSRRAEDLRTHTGTKRPQWDALRRLLSSRT